MYNRHTNPIGTPWGVAQSVTILAPGITHLTTASHGGIHLDDQRQAKMPEILRSADGYYEEDVCWARAAVIFPEGFSDYEHFWAVRTLVQWEPELWEPFTKTPPGAAALARHDAFFEQNRAKFDIGCSSTSGNGWTLSARSLDRTRSIKISCDCSYMDKLTVPFSIEDLERHR